MPINDYEDVSVYGLDAEREVELLDRQNECTFCWSTRDGSPMAVIMSYLYRDGRFWLTASGQRKRIAAVRRDPRVSIVVSSAGTSLPPNRTVTYKGRCRVHDDETTKRWFYPALAAALHPSDAERAEVFARFLDSPRRVVLEVQPVQRIGFDGTKMSAATTAAAWGGNDARP